MPGERKRAKTATDGWKRRRLSNSKSPPNRPKTLRNWSDDSTRQAIEAVRSEEMGANRGARAFGVPASTLKDRLSGRVKHGTNPGPIPYLSSEENELATFLIECSKSVMARLRNTADCRKDTNPWHALLLYMLIYLYTCNTRAIDVQMLQFFVRME